MNSDGSVAKYTKWWEGEPNNSGNNEDCARVKLEDTFGGMNDVDCMVESAYIC